MAFSESLSPRTQAHHSFPNLFPRSPNTRFPRFLSFSLTHFSRLYDVTAIHRYNARRCRQSVWCGPYTGPTSPPALQPGCWKMLKNFVRSKLEIALYLGMGRACEKSAQTLLARLPHISAHADRPRAESLWKYECPRFIFIRALDPPASSSCHSRTEGTHAWSPCEPSSRERKGAFFHQGNIPPFDVRSHSSPRRRTTLPE